MLKPTIKSYRAHYIKDQSMLINQFQIKTKAVSIILIILPIIPYIIEIHLLFSIKILLP